MTECQCRRGQVASRPWRLALCERWPTANAPAVVLLGYGCRGAQHCSRTDLPGCFQHPGRL